MKIELVQGCIAYRFDADGKPMMDMSEGELKDILIKVVNKVTQRTELTEGQKSYLYDAIMLLVEDFPDRCLYSDEPCECCGDWIETYTMEINPIPITEEWLTKNDFKKEYSPIVEYYSYKRLIDGYYVDIQFGCSNMGDEYVNCHIDNCDRCTVASVDIQYVHQLQNLLNIMNINIDIKL